MSTIRRQQKVLTPSPSSHNITTHGRSPQSHRHHQLPTSQYVNNLADLQIPLLTAPDNNIHIHTQRPPYTQHTKHLLKRHVRSTHSQQENTQLTCLPPSSRTMNDAVSAVLAAVGIVAVFGGVAIVVHAYSEWVWSAPAWRAGPDAAASPAV